VAPTDEVLAGLFFLIFIFFLLSTLRGRL